MSKMSKKSSAKASTTSSGAQLVSSSASTVSSATEMPAIETALSPSRHSRLHEKNSLVNLNNRLACYIERVGFLEQENSRLSHELSAYHETASREVGNLKSIYDLELADARKLLDETAREKAKAEIEAKRIWEENEQLRVKLNRRTKELHDLEKEARANETRCIELTANYNSVSSEKRKLQETLKELEKETEKVHRTFDTMRKDCERETLIRVDLENNIQSLREELTFKEQVHSQEMSESKMRRHSEITEIDGFLMDQYETKLQQTLHELREQYDLQLRSNRDEISELYESRVHELEERLTITRGQYEQEKTKLLAELERLRNEVSVQLKEYQDLMDIKISLDMEIAAYDKLLSSEETRLNITPSVTSTTSGGGSASSMSVFGATSRLFRTPSLKRKRNVLDESVDFVVTAHAKGDIEISECDVDGKFVRIRNKSADEHKLDGFQLVRRPKDAPDVAFQFPKGAKIEGKSTVTVWSAMANQKVAAPATLVMKSNAIWTVTDWMSTVLLDEAGEEVAVNERQKVKTVNLSGHKDKYFLEESGSRVGLSYMTGKAAANGAKEEKNDEQCVVM